MVKISKMLVVNALITLVPWLTQASCFAPGPPIAPKAAVHRHRFHRTNSNAGTQLSQSVNDSMSGFHYDQEPRGTSFISQISQKDLHERRQMRRPRSWQDRQLDRRIAPNSRGASAPQQYQQAVAAHQQAVAAVAPPQYQQAVIAVAPPQAVVAAPPQYYPNGRGGPAPQQVVVAPPQQYYPNDNVVNNGIGGGGGGEFGGIQDNVSANLQSMTGLLKEMQMSQAIQSTDVQALTLKVADMAQRLSRTEAAKNQMGNNQNSPGGMGNKEVSFGTSLDGEFHQKIKDVIGEFDMVDRSVSGGYSQDDDYYKSRIAELDTKINMVDDALRATEEKFSTQMEYVDLLVNQRLDDIDDATAFDNNMRFQQMPPPPPQPTFFEDGPPPPHMEEFSPMPPPRPQEGYDANPYGMDDDNGQTYFQERNYNVPNIPPPPSQEISSTQKKQQQSHPSDQQRSVNTRSGGQHYNEKNNSFISAFSQADNERRKEFQPFSRDERRNQIGQGQGGGDHQALSRGTSRPPPNRRMSMGPPEPMLPMMEERPPYFEFEEQEPYFYEDGPGMMMEEDYFYDDMMYEF